MNAHRLSFVDKTLFLRIAAATLFLIHAVLWARTGFYPAASVADDAWFSEAGYHLLHDGELRRPWLSDDLGGAIRDFYPPVTAIIQAAFFAVFGLNAFGEMAQASLACSILSLLVLFIVRKNGAPWGTALVASIAIFGWQIVLEQSIRVRNEQWMAVFLLACVLLRQHSGLNKGPRGLAFEFGAGICVGLACLTYYPYAPAAVVAGFVGISVRDSEGCRRLVSWILGGAVMLVIMIVYISPDWDMFLAQELSAGRFRFGTLRILSPLLNLFVLPDHGAWQGPGRFFLMAWESAIVLLTSAGLSLFLPSGSARLHATRSIVMALPYFIYGWPLQLLSAGIFLVLALAALCSKDAAAAPLRRKIAFVALSLLAMSAVGKISWIGTVAYLQREGRDYAAVTAQLDRLVTEPGRVAGDRAIWLALRPRLGPEDLHWLVEGKHFQDFIFRSLILRGPDASKHFKYLVVDKDRSLASIAQEYPGFREDIESGNIREVGRVDLPFRSLPFARTAPYDLVVYKRFQ